MQAARMRRQERVSERSGTSYLAGAVRKKVAWNVTESLETIAESSMTVSAIPCAADANGDGGDPSKEECKRGFSGG